ncbi:MAG: hypothetical protein ACRDWN_05815, partial [Acidimicrobiales bacterium]
APAPAAPAPAVPAPAAPAPARPARPPLPVEPAPLNAAPVEPAPLNAALVELLLAAGFPRELLGSPPASARSTLESAFASLPAPPALPSDRGGLVAIVGDARLVRPTARAVALAVGCPPDEVAVAAPAGGAGHPTPAYRVRTADQAASMANGWRRDRVGVVAVYAPPLGSDQQWTRQVLRALRPSCVWGTASATTKTDDVRRWVAAVGGVDALALTDVSRTATPAAALATGVPVARLDDDEATPGRWAALVAELATRH